MKQSWETMTSKLRAIYKLTTTKDSVRDSPMHLTEPDNLARNWAKSTSSTGRLVTVTTFSVGVRVRPAFVSVSVMWTWKLDLKKKMFLIILSHSFQLSITALGIIFAHTQYTHPANIIINGGEGEQSEYDTVQTLHYQDTGIKYRAVVCPIKSSSSQHKSQYCLSWNHFDHIKSSPSQHKSQYCSSWNHFDPIKSLPSQHKSQTWHFHRTLPGRLSVWIWLLNLCLVGSKSDDAGVTTSQDFQEHDQWLLFRTCQI